MAVGNTCIFIGNLTQDAEIKNFGESELAVFTVAAPGGWDKEARKQGTVFASMNLWNPKGLAPYLKKGARVAVQCEYEQRRTERDGEKRTYHQFKVVPFGLQLVGGKSSKSPVEDDDDDEMPF